MSFYSLPGFGLIDFVILITAGPGYISIYPTCFELCSEPKRTAPFRLLLCQFTSMAEFDSGFEPYSGLNHLGNCNRA